MFFLLFLIRLNVVFRFICSYHLGLSFVCPLVFVTLSCTFRYGRDDVNVLGIAFRRELYVSTRQVYPPLQDRDRGIHSRTQAQLLRKLGECAFPFFFEVRVAPLWYCANF